MMPAHYGTHTGHKIPVKKEKPVSNAKLEVPEKPEQTKSWDSSYHDGQGFTRDLTVPGGGQS